MPKRRTAASIAQRMGGRSPDYEEREMSERLNQRLTDAGEIQVEMRSQSRGRIETIGVTFDIAGGATMRSESGREYQVTLGPEATCNCQDFTHRGGRCRHIEAADFAREQVGQGWQTGSASAATVVNPEIINDSIRNETEAEVSLNQREFRDDGFFYTEHPDVFERDKQDLLSQPVPYYYDNVLNGSDVTFGVELEFVDGDSNAIAQELYDLGICGSQAMNGYHGMRMADKWSVERDGSVTRGNYGGEIISPVLQDTPETWLQIETICEVAKRHGASVNTSTGAHVHVGASKPLDGKRQRWRRFFKSCFGFEKVYHRLAGGEQGRLRSNPYVNSARDQNRGGIIRALPNDGTDADFQRIIGRLSRGKYQSVNIGSFTHSRKTIEFRAFNGTLTPGIIQANVKYATGVVNTSERSRIKRSENVNATESDRKRGRIINDYETHDNETDTAMMRTLDAVFARREDKQQILSVLLRNDWAR